MTITPGGPGLTIEDAKRVIAKRHLNAARQPRRAEALFDDERERVHCRVIYCARAIKRLNDNAPTT